MDIILNNSSGEPFYEQIVRQMKRLVQTGERSEEHTSELQSLSC